MLVVDNSVKRKMDFQDEEKEGTASQKTKQVVEEKIHQFNSVKGRRNAISFDDWQAKMLQAMLSAAQKGEDS